MSGHLQCPRCLRTCDWAGDCPGCGWNPFYQREDMDIDEELWPRRPQ